MILDKRELITEFTHVGFSILAVNPTLI